MEEKRVKFIEETVNHNADVLGNWVGNVRDMSVALSKTMEVTRGTLNIVSDLAKDVTTQAKKQKKLKRNIKLVALVSGVYFVKNRIQINRQAMRINRLEKELEAIKEKETIIREE